jgi:magnesium transporter
MNPRPPARTPALIPVVLGTTILRSFVPSAASAVACLIELGAVAFFAAGVAGWTVGPAAPWFLLIAVVIGLAVRAVDLETCALFIPGGVRSAAGEAFGRPAAGMAASALLVEQLLAGALAASVAGHYVAALGAGIFGSTPTPPPVVHAEASTLFAIGVLGLVWWWQREGRPVFVGGQVRIAWAAVVLLVVVVAWGGGTAIAQHPVPLPVVPWPSLSASLAAIGLCLFAMGSSEALAHIAPDVPPPTIRHLRRTAQLAGAFALLVVAASGFVLYALVPLDTREAWVEAPLAAIALHVAAPEGLRFVLLMLVAIAAALFLSGAIQRSVSGAQRVLARLSQEGILSPALRALHPRLGTQARLVDVAIAAQVAVVIFTDSKVMSLAHAYAIGLACTTLTKIAVLIRLRTRRPEPRAFRVALNIRLGGREHPVGLMVLALVITMTAVAVLLTRDAASIVGAALVLAGTVWFTVAEERAARRASEKTSAPDFDLLISPSIGLQQVETRPGNLLVTVRRPHVLAHLGAALQVAGPRDVVVMTARLVGVDTPDDLSSPAQASEDERKLMAAVVALAERHGHAVRLLIAPATNIFDAIVQTASQLRSAEIYVGESETLSAGDQSRLLGEAWERLPHGEPLDVRLVIHHSSGRTASFHLGEHPPTLTPDDFHLIHTLWLDVVKKVGPHVHHHDVVRAALKHMEHDLSNEGPPREHVLEVIQHVARPADELAAAVKQGDFARVRDTVRNRPAGDLAALLTDLPVEEQVVMFRVLPRKVAAATFEYLSQDDQEALIRAMAQEDVAGLLNNMAPDDRTMFLEELPASVTQQMLSLLSPEERSIAVTLLGYPEGSIGRLMTPDYIAIREHWTVQEVLEYVRAHGHDSETLNVLYVVDDHGVLVDDVRIREFLLTALTSRVSDLMDRRFVLLKATDDQTTAVSTFRGADRSALPVTDSAGVLIGIVTVDDVIDVAEAAATKEIQRIGGSEALDEPYMEISFARMIRKRAGWLTALFIGEMLTATAMGVFEHEIERAVVLALFVPLIISSGGNSGSQASTLVIRAIALGEVRLSDWWRVMRREIGAGLALGSILGSIGFVRIAVWSAFSTLYGEHWFLVALTVGLSLIGVVLWGTLIGSLLPFLLRRLGFDPATSSAPFVATLVDVTGLVIYFSVGLLLLRGTVL